MQRLRSVIGMLLALGFRTGAAESRELVRDTTWAPPLSRPVSLRAREVSLREALDRLAAGAKLRLSYSGEVLPLDRRVSAAFDSVMVGDALTTLLSGTPIRLVVLSADHVVLAPGEQPAAPVPQAPRQLDRIVVTGSADGAAERGLPIALDVLPGRVLARRSAATLSDALNASIPGIWTWEQSPLSLLAQYGSIRGASSFGTTYPKVYLDGIQLANPLLLTRIQPDALDRIEVIRGPQGAALYGADAISGVANLVSRYGPPGDGSRARVGAGLGLAGSSYVADPAVRQDYGLALHLGSNLRSASMTVDAGSLGAYFPSSYSRQLAATGTLRQVGAKSILTGTLRLFGMRASALESPVITSALAPARASGTITGPLAQPRSGVESLGEYTAGLNLKLFPNDRWQHSLVAGIDGYVLNGVPDDHALIPFADLGALDDARGAAARATLRASSVRKLQFSPSARADLTLAAEQSILRERAVIDQLMPRGGQPGSNPPASRELVRWRGNTGLVGQLNTAIAEQVFLSAGARIERDEGASGTGRTATLPMVGAAWSRDYHGLTFKLRGAYGKGIRWPEIPARETLWEGLRPGTAAAIGLEPEKQSGVEAGLDLFVGRAWSFKLTRFDQTASGLIQRVSVPSDTTTTPPPGGPHLAFQLQNVGEITNRGWEIQSAVQRGRFSLTGAFTQVDSRVRRLAVGYTGDLQPGDRMLDVPRRTLSLTGSWSSSRWQASLAGYRAMSWIGYDRVALVQAFATYSHPNHDFVGANLRNYWKEYHGVTHLNAVLSYTFRSRMAFTLNGSNLLDRQTGEPDNVTVLPGRTISFGIRTTF